MKPYDTTQLKNMNTRTVYTLLYEHGELSRSEISKHSNISVPTILKITNYLLQENLIIDAGERAPRLGRKPQMFKCNPNVAFSVGIEYEGDYLKIGVVNIAEEIQVISKLQVLSDFDNVMDIVLAESIGNLLAEAGIEKEKVFGVGIGIPAVVDTDSFEMRYAPLVGVTSALSINQSAGAISQKIGLPVFIYNDVNSAAIGEYSTRKLKDEDLVYVSLGTGLGAGIVLNGELRSGKHFLAGEIGYVTNDADYAQNMSQAGWLESSINLAALKKRFADFEKRIAAHDTQEIAAYAAQPLSMALANIANFLDVDMIVLGGVVTDMLGDVFVKAVTEAMRRYSLFDITVERNRCAEPGIVGSAHMVTNKMFDKF
ncbi:MAG: ROK family protein [Peptococcaceae bacterium]|nr:ROK family protein [Peptococcaceae bacterium]